MWLPTIAFIFLLCLVETPSTSVLTLRDELEKATREKDKKSLARIIEGAERARLPELDPLLRKARDTLESLGGGRGG